MYTRGFLAGFTVKFAERTSVHPFKDQIAYRPVSSVQTGRIGRGLSEHVQM